MVVSDTRMSGGSKATRAGQKLGRKHQTAAGGGGWRDRQRKEREKMSFRLESVFLTNQINLAEFLSSNDFLAKHG